MRSVPRYLSKQAALWRENPHAANQKWFEQAKFGLFIHYGLYSSLKTNDAWSQFLQKIPVVEYAQLKESFRADRFDADFITDLALEAGMTYITLVSCHHDSFCLWNSKTEAFNSSNSPCGRDLVRELAEQCDRKGLGFFVYYTFMLNWRHPYFLSRDYFAVARPDYAEPPPEYKFQSLEDYPKYVEYMLSCLRELLELEYPLAGVWLDIVSAYYRIPHLVPLKETYELIRRLRPEALIAYKQGATGEEDFAAPEFACHSLGEAMLKSGDTEAAKRADRAWERNKGKHNEICMTLQEHGWGYNEASRHLSPDEVWNRLEYAAANNCNLLANVGPLPDGSIHPEDVATLREIGRRIRSTGWPMADASRPGTSESVKIEPTGAGAE